MAQNAYQAEACTFEGIPGNQDSGVYYRGKSGSLRHGEEQAKELETPTSFQGAPITTVASTQTR